MRGMGVWVIFGGLMIYGMIGRAQNEPVVPSDDRKEPKTLNKVVAADSAKRPVTDALDGETHYRPGAGAALAPAVATPTPMPILEPIKGGSLNKTVDQVTVRGYQVRPLTMQVQGAILLLPEWWGLNDTMRGEADRWARQGYKVLAVDLYGGETARTRAQAARLMGRLKPEKVMPQLKAALTLAAQPAQADTTGTLKVAVMGFGIGSTYAQRLAAADDRPSALVLFYGDLLKDPQEIRKIKAPTLAVFASGDGWITPEKIAAFSKAMTGSKLPPQTFTYMTQPGFLFNPIDAAGKNYADLARKATQDFLKRELGL